MEPENGEDAEASKREKAGIQQTKLGAMCNTIAQALAQSAAQGKQLENIAMAAKVRKMEAEKELERHVSHIRDLLTYYQRQQQNALTASLRDFVEKLLVCKTEALNHEAKLKDLERRVTEKLHVITNQNDVTRADRRHVNALSKELKMNATPSLAPEIVQGPSYSLQIPDAISDTVQSVVGVFVTSSDSMASPTSHLGNPENSESSGMGGKTFPSQSSGAEANNVPHSSTKGTRSERGDGTTKEVPNEAKKRAKKTKKKAKETSDTHLNQDDVTSTTDTFPSSPQDTGFQSQPSSSKEAKKTKKKKKKRMKKASKTHLNQNDVNSTPNTTTPSSSQQNNAQSQPSADSRKSKPKDLNSRGKVVSCLAVRVDGKVWIVYKTDPHLDLLDKSGNIVQSIKMENTAKHIAAYGLTDVLVVSDSVPCLLTVFRTGADLDSEVIKVLNYRCTGVAVSRSGIAVSSSRTIYWLSSQGSNNQWIVTKKSSSLKNVSCLAALEAEGKEFICAADHGEKAVHIYRKSLRGRFVALDPLRSVDERVSFVPVSMSAHPAGYLAVLDDVSRCVYVVGMGKERVLSVTVMDGFGLCDGVPCLLAFRPSQDLATRPALWAANTAGHVCLTRLSFQFELP